MVIAVDTRLLLTGKLTGIGHYTFEILKVLVRAHPEVSFIFLFDRKFDPSFVFAENIRPVVLFPQARAAPLIHWWFQYAIPRFIKKEAVDVFLSLEHYLPIGLPVPSILTIHDIAFHHYPETNRWLDRVYNRMMTPRFIAAAHAVVTVSDATRKDLRSVYSVSPDKITVCPPAVWFTEDTEQSQPSIEVKAMVDRPYFVHLGTIEPRKNIVRLLRAFDQYKSQTGSPAKLLFIGGKGWKDQSIYQAFEKMRYRSDVEFMGYLQASDIRYLIQHAIALTYVSLFEGFGMPIIEAQYLGCPVITSNVSSMPEAAGKGAVLIDPLDVDSIAEALAILENEPQIRHDLIRLGAENVKRFSWQVSAQNIWSVIQSVTTKPSSL